MKYVRATIRLVALCGSTAGYYLLWLVGTPFALFFPAGRRRWRNRNFGGWARLSARILGLQIHVRNLRPAAPFLLVSNHLSYIDVVVLAAQLDCAFIAKSEVAGWPIVGLLCRSMNTIFINRKRKRELVQALTKIGHSLDSRTGVVLFAEGTSTNGAAVLPFRSSLLEFAVRRQLPVHYASISYAVSRGENSADQSVCWWGDMTFPGHFFRLLQLPRFEANLVFGKQPIVAHDRRVLAAELWSAVRAHFTPVVVSR